MSHAKRCFISQLHSDNIVANSRESLVRIIGVLTETRSAPQEQQEMGLFPGQYREGELVLIAVDDGTAVVDIWTPYSMIQSLSLVAGASVECIARLCQNSSVKRWYAETLILNTQPHVENLRWLELSHPETTRNYSRRFGYPTISMDCDEAFRLLILQSRLSKEGVRMEDLALVMQKSEAEMQKMIQQLQLNGQIYQNEEGKFLPL